MEKKACAEKVCKRCGWCCTSLGRSVGLTEKESENLRRVIFEKAGVIYLRDPGRFYLAFKEAEKKRMEPAAKKLGIAADIQPNKLIYDKAKGKVIVFDYYLNHEKCPFYKERECLIYADRPLACRKFPKLDNSYAEEVADFIKGNRISFEGVAYEEAKKKCEQFLKKK